MTLTGAINVILLTIHENAERHDGFSDLNGKAHVERLRMSALHQRPTPDVLTSTRMTGTELA
jgi:hypothetical protein